MDQPETYPTPAYHPGTANVVLRADDGRSIEVDALSFDDLLNLAAITRTPVIKVFGDAVEDARSAALRPAPKAAASSGDGTPRPRKSTAKAAS